VNINASKALQIAFKDSVSVILRYDVHLAKPDWGDEKIEENINDEQKMKQLYKKD